MADVGEWKTIWQQILAALPVVSLFVAGCSLGLSWYTQYLQGPRNAAADYSRFYLTNADFSKSYDRIVALVTKIPTPPPPTGEEALKVRSFVDFLDHVSYLVNHSLIDNAFVANRIKCDISYINTNVLPTLGKVLPDLRVQYKLASLNSIEYFETGKTAACSEKWAHD